MHLSGGGPGWWHAVPWARHCVGQHAAAGCTQCRLLLTPAHSHWHAPIPPPVAAADEAHYHLWSAIHKRTHSSIGDYASRLSNFLRSKAAVLAHNLAHASQEAGTTRLRLLPLLPPAGGAAPSAHLAGCMLAGLPHARGSCIATEEHAASGDACMSVCMRRLQFHQRQQPALSQLISAACGTADAPGYSLKLNHFADMDRDEFDRVMLPRKWRRSHGQDVNRVRGRGQQGFRCPRPAHHLPALRTGATHHDGTQRWWPATHRSCTLPVRRGGPSAVLWPAAIKAP